MSDPACILLIEDDADLRATTTDILELEGYRVAQAENGLAALAWLRDPANPQPMLMLLDLSMPIMNGSQFRAAQRADPSLATIPVIALTAGRSSVEALAGLEFEAVLYKPVDIGELLAWLGRYAQRCAITRAPSG